MTRTPVTIYIIIETFHAGAIRKSSPVIVGSLLVMVTALTFSILGSNKHDVKTLVAAILYITGGIPSTLIRSVIYSKLFKERDKRCLLNSGTN